MAHYRKKPVVIEAIQFNNLNHDEINNFVGQKLQSEIESDAAYEAGKGAPVSSIIIPTSEGNMKAMPGDWIIKGIKGEFYPCKPDIFEATYEVVSSEETNADETTTEGDTTLDDGGNGGNHPPGGPGKP